jgi:hypothetical protein
MTTERGKVIALAPKRAPLDRTCKPLHSAGVAKRYHKVVAGCDAQYSLPSVFPPAATRPPVATRFARPRGKAGFV